jgi:hypothetical protein
MMKIERFEAFIFVVQWTFYGAGLYLLIRWLGPAMADWPCAGHDLRLSGKA